MRTACLTVGGKGICRSCGGASMYPGPGWLGSRTFTSLPHARPHLTSGEGLSCPASLPALLPVPLPQSSWGHPPLMGTWGPLPVLSVPLSSPQIYHWAHSSLMLQQNPWFFASLVFSLPECSYLPWPSPHHHLSLITPSLPVQHYFYALSKYHLLEEVFSNFR